MLLRDALDADARRFGSLIVEIAATIDQLVPGKVAIVVDDDHTLIAIRIDGMPRSVAEDLPEAFRLRTRVHRPTEREA
jgi:hypothetical protein